MGMSKEVKLRKYLEEKVDPFLKPLLLDLMKNQPQDVFPYLENWIQNQGNKINDNMHTKEMEKSVHYEELKKSVVDIKAEAPIPQEPEETAATSLKDVPAPEEKKEAPVEEEIKTEAPAEET